MNTLTASYIARGETWLLITTLAYFLMNGAQLFETAVIVPKWSQHPPASLHYFKAPYDLDLKTFWIIIHSLHEITFILAIVFCWHIDPIRNWLLVLFAIHFAVRVWTLTYFAPNIIAFQAIANGAPEPAGLVARAHQWRFLNCIRVGIFIAVSFGLLPLCSTIMRLKAA
ncbi:transposase [Paraflavitalea sp. CAU 1676]|uniref:transposase n=1 Tax=Paraflavitalea sp. CAU 1676 TaxID=3032598 RepID=UPI0023DCAF14|nr:transposase [Paraflavitalea sp. CAU 1676]MDF2188292.1 transposase [Paraflavitalea sp. CAU 1676]